MLVLVIGDLHIPTRAHDLPAKFKKLLVPGKISQILSTGNITDRETWDYLRSIVGGELRGVRGDWDEPAPHLPPSTVLTFGPLRIGVISGHQIVPLGDAEILAATARKMNVDVLISGGTHRFEAFESDGRFFLNPGSATGAFSPYWTPLPPSTAPPSAAGGDGEGESGASAEGGAGEGKEGEGKKAVQQGSERGDDESDGGEDGEGEEEGPTPSFALLDIQGNVVVTYVYTEKDGDVQVEKMEYRRNPTP